MTIPTSSRRGLAGWQRLLILVTSSSLPCHCLVDLVPQPDIFRGIPPHRIDFYKSRLIDPATREWKCVNSSEPDVNVLLNDDYCDCPDGSDEPGTSACSGIEAVRDQYDMYLDEAVEGGRLPVLYSDGTTSALLFDRERQLALPNPGFYCPQKGFYPKYIPSWKVNDMICDCCDGSDESPSDACPNTCATLMAEHQTTKERHLKEEANLIISGQERYSEGLSQLAEWDNLMVNGPRLIELAEAELARLEAEREVNKTHQGVDSEEGETDMEDSEGDGEDEEEWVEEWNEDGSIKRVKKEKESSSEAPKRALLESQIEADSLWRRTYSNLVNYLGRGLDRVRNLVSRVHANPSPTAGEAQQYTPSASYHDPVSVKSRELQSLKDKYNRAQSRANNPLYREFPQIVAWSDRTLTWRTGETTYTVSILGSAYSRQNWDNKVELGTFSKVVSVSEFLAKTGWMEATVGRGIFAPWALLYENGDLCTPESSSATTEGQERIRSLVFLVCAEEDQLLVWEEQEPCRWTGTIGTPAFCNVLSSEQKHPMLAKTKDEL